VVGFASDAGQALVWYEKALALGSGEAQQRIQRLTVARSR
jgi:TPR repeat protein